MVQSHSGKKSNIVEDRLSVEFTGLNRSLALNLHAESIFSIHRILITLGFCAPSSHLRSEILTAWQAFMFKTHRYLGLRSRIKNEAVTKSALELIHNASVIAGDESLARYIQKVKSNFLHSSETSNADEAPSNCARLKNILIESELLWKSGFFSRVVSFCESNLGFVDENGHQAERILMRLYAQASLLELNRVVESEVVSLEIQKISKNFDFRKSSTSFLAKVMEIRLAENTLNPTASKSFDLAMKVVRGLGLKNRDLSFAQSMQLIQQSLTLSSAKKACDIELASKNLLDEIMKTSAMKLDAELSLFSCISNAIYHRINNQIESAEMNFSLAVELAKKETSLRAINFAFQEAINFSIKTGKSEIAESLKLYLEGLVKDEQPFEKAA